MKKMAFLISVFILFLSSQVSAQPLERIIQSLPVFAAYSEIQAESGILTVGVFSDTQQEVGAATLEKFANLKSWNHKSVQEITKHTTIETISLNGDNVSSFNGQIIWVIDAQASLAKLKAKTEEGVFTVGAQNDTYKDFLLTTLIYQDKSSDPKVERWRLIEFYGNCAISPISFSKKLVGKDNFVSNKCGK